METIKYNLTVRSTDAKYGQGCVHPFKNRKKQFNSLIVSFYKNHSSKILPNPQKLLKTNKKESFIQFYYLQSRPSLNSVPEGQGVLKF